jgi:predicted GNAT family acetyltransferase
MHQRYIGSASLASPVRVAPVPPISGTLESVLMVPVRQLGETERGSVERLLDADPLGAAQVAERVAARGLVWWRADGRIFGYGSRRHVESLCWLGGHLTPVLATAPAVAAFAERMAAEERTCSSIVGRADAVLDLWSRLSAHWGPARDVRPHQPLLVADTPPSVNPDPAVRLVRPEEANALFRAAVAMYTEEVGVSPLMDDGGRGYRRRVADLARGRRAYARFVDGEVVFKAELAVVTRHTAQVQGVWVDPRWRGKGIAAPAVAAVMRDALGRVAPTVSLYVNDYNEPARRAYARCGFRPAGAFATVLF